MLTSSWKSSQMSATSGSTRTIVLTSEEVVTRDLADQPADPARTAGSAGGEGRSEAEEPVQQVAVAAYRHPQLLGVGRVGALPPVQLLAVPGQRVGHLLAHVTGQA